MIRPMKEQDIPYIADINLQAFGKRNIEQLEAILKNNNYKYFVYVDGFIIKGFLGLLMVDGEVAEIITVCVDANYRHVGIGTKLMKYAEDCAVDMGYSKLALEVKSSNMPAVKMYYKLKFVPISIRKKYYDGVEDAIVMHKNLK